MVDIRLENISKTFISDDAQAIVALRAFDLNIRSGEIVVLIGPSGGGQTTLVRLIAGLESLDQGRVYFNEVDVTDDLPHHQDIASLLHDEARYPYRGSGGNRPFPFRVKGREEEFEERVQATCEIMGIDLDLLIDGELLDLPAGERETVAIGRCLVHGPILFLCDEPLAQLDAPLRGKIGLQLKQLLRRFQITSIYATHDQSQAFALADRLVIMRDGWVMQVGTPAEIYERPVNQFVADFLGELPINLFSGVIRGGVFHGDGFSIPLPRNAERLKDGDLVVVGIRPEHVGLSADGVEVRVERWEPLYHEKTQILHTSFGDVRCVAKVQIPRRISIKDNVGLHFNPDSLLFFHPDTGENIVMTVRYGQMEQ